MYGFYGIYPDKRESSLGTATVNGAKGHMNHPARSPSCALHNDVLTAS